VFVGGVDVVLRHLRARTLVAASKKRTRHGAHDGVPRVVALAHHGAAVLARVRLEEALG